MYEVSDAMVCLMGIGTVFIGLVVLVILCKAMSTIVASREKKEPCTDVQQLERKVGKDEIDRNTLIAMSTAAIAEMLGTDVAGIRVVSFKKVEGE